MWELDPDVYGDSDLFGHEVEPIDIAPIRSYGSLAQLQGRDGTHYEDYTEDLPAQQMPADLAQSRHSAAFLPARTHRDTFSVSQFIRNRLCDPEHILSIEEAIGNPPEFDMDIRDTSGVRLRESDMRVPSGSRGESAFESTKHASRQCPPHPKSELGGCDLLRKWSFLQSTMLSMVYVTSSDDPGVQPGIHRLVDLKAFADLNCDQLKNQRCGVRREIVSHSRPQPKCGFFCKTGQLGMGILGAGTVYYLAGVEYQIKPGLSAGSSATSFMRPDWIPPVDEAGDLRSVRAKYHLYLEMRALVSPPPATHTQKANQFTDPIPPIPV